MTRCSQVLIGRHAAYGDEQECQIELQRDGDIVTVAYRDGETHVSDAVIEIVRYFDFVYSAEGCLIGPVAWLELKERLHRFNMIN